MIHIESLDGIVVLRFDRPPANAIDLEAARRLTDGVGQVVADASARALVITGRPGFFSAGLDLKAVPNYGLSEQREMVQGVNRLVLSVYGASLPVVAAMSGHAIAGGLVVALACDYRVAAAGRFQLGLTESRVAVPYPMAAMSVVRAELPAPAARTLVLIGRNVGPEDARALAVVDEVVPADEVLSRSLAMARDLAAAPREGFGRIKRQLRADALARIEECIDRESDPLLGSWLSAETPSAARAMLERDRK